MKFYVVWKFCVAKFYYEKFNIKEVAHQYKSAVTFKKLHKIYIDVATEYHHWRVNLFGTQRFLSHNDAITRA